MEDLGFFWGALLLLAAFMFYFLPSIVAKNESPTWGVFIVNLLFGWTVIGWIAALIWGLSYSNTPRQNTVINKKTESDKYDKLLKLKDLLDKGVISEDQYNIEKEKILY